jgi:hypothetical protein
METMKRVPLGRSYSGGDVSASDISLIGSEGWSTLRSSKEKQGLLGDFIGDVQDLFLAFETNKIFASMLG